MQLSQLIELLSPLDHKGSLDLSFPLLGLAVNSNAVQSDYIFVALPSVWEGKAGGEQYVEAAISKGARVIVTHQSIPSEISSQTYWLQVKSCHLALAHMARSFFPRQPSTVVAVTGTNGKSSIVDFTFQLWSMAGFNCARMGTIGVQDNLNHSYPGIAGLTTPDAIVVHQMMQSLQQNGIEYLAMESSSHALDQHRMDCVAIKIASFTNLTHEHLDYHKDSDQYFKAKSRLFADLLPADGIAVVNIDDAYAEPLLRIIKHKSQRVVTYGSSAADIQYTIKALHGNGQDISVSIFGKSYDIHFPLIGNFQVSNAMCALAHALLTGVDERLAVDGLSKLTSVPGRLQKVGEQVYVDYAHSPDALSTALKALRPHTKKKLLVIFGCGGNRDPFKRPLMGKVAQDLADIVYVADDNPRFEDPAMIRRQIMEACPSAIEFETREDAIFKAVQSLKDGDILLIAGKGHETGQIVGAQIQPFNDVTVAQQALLSLGCK